MPRAQTQPVKTPADWARRRAHVLEAFQAVAGGLPDSSHRVPLNVQARRSRERQAHASKDHAIAAEPGDRVPAYVLIPKGLKKPAPAMLCLHQTTEIGKDEPAGAGGQCEPALCATNWPTAAMCASCRIIPRWASTPTISRPRRRRPAARSRPSGTTSADRRAGNVLPEVDPRRIGVIGHSLGGHNAIFTALFDLRIKAIVTSCGFTALADDDLASWTGPRYMPRLRRRWRDSNRRCRLSSTS